MRLPCMHQGHLVAGRQGFEHQADLPLLHGEALDHAALVPDSDLLRAILLAERQNLAGAQHDFKITSNGTDREGSSRCNLTASVPLAQLEV